MARVKRGIVSHKRRKNALARTKGFRWGRKSKYRLAKDALRHAWTYAYRDRRAKKRAFRQDWQRQLGGALTLQNLNYSRFIAALKKQNVGLDRKVLAQLAKEHPKAFQKIIELCKA
ncbi:MAG TPA: 50S ribosomal protein L20 [Candidatus Wildermuthbacteria bacterium]|uniref:Large ribosomal subunit protein bL20 n=1 Tax=Candidatus Yanofskybacteria bacterium GW2011_GWC1_48_11 TaxID=1619027 RepID=A0A837ILW1_9BACT|nr:MAG: 50S ribosomal protein L20 [Candidatus Yanofskybacteria bacterium GW2011_GWC1_48_11]KKW03978.1 MAG: 50S ribosomal protein L20 [Parcubacteria group bacterium GW2011_GWB1_49_12]KKW08676.1 MAG: 50S ribosomal protein L20 [Parcubacteria group bacterium GW2011_GWA1_49_26]KKW13893.1 MAG: 50S ribosomal protein L20 [Parcubacteria group bacterium GW2011_GWA2_50_10]OHA61626.1 MAG: 50S ribosomal protein L20 [Candidatus Wildermuthbacteria bacterium GWA1_49_26]OHA65344.1 MAG: 50S ribosomal protein L2